MTKCVKLKEAATMPRLNSRCFLNVLPFSLLPPNLPLSAKVWKLILTFQVFAKLLAQETIGAGRGDRVYSAEKGVNGFLVWLHLLHLCQPPV